MNKRILGVIVAMTWLMVTINSFAVKDNVSVRPFNNQRNLVPGKLVYRIGDRSAGAQNGLQKLNKQMKMREQTEKLIRLVKIATKLEQEKKEKLKAKKSN